MTTPPSDHRKETSERSTQHADPAARQDCRRARSTYHRHRGRWRDRTRRKCTQQTPPPSHQPRERQGRLGTQQAEAHAAHSTRTCRREGRHQTEWRQVARTCEGRRPRRARFTASKHDTSPRPVATGCGHRQLPRAIRRRGREVRRAVARRWRRLLPRARTTRARTVRRPVRTRDRRGARGDRRRSGPSSRRITERSTRPVGLCCASESAHHP
jgi:hypothetical protein